MVVSAVTPRGAFLARPRDVSLFDAALVGGFTIEALADHSSIEAAAPDGSLRKMYGAEVNTALFNFLHSVGVYDDTIVAFQARSYDEPTGLSQSLQCLMGKRSGSEYLAIPASEDYARGDTIDFVVTKMVYDLGRVDARLTEMLSVINEAKQNPYPETLDVNVEELTAEYDSLLDDVRREHPAYQPNC